VAFILTRSNRVERLAAALADVVSEPLPNPLARELIVVQGPGMERWLSMQLAERLTVWANPWFPFPRTLVELALDAACGAESKPSPLYAPNVLGFLIARLLPALLDRPEFAEARGYLADDAQGDRLLTLAQSLAKTYDQYLIYRPDLILAWETSNQPQFQAILWRAVAQVAGPSHMARRLDTLRRSDGDGRVDEALRASLPPRMHVFGISTLPPAFLGVLSRIARVTDVHFFLLSPTHHYYGELDRSHAAGHDMTSLLANLGKVGRELTEQLTELDTHERDLFTAPAPDSILHALQSDLMNLTVRGPDAEPPLSVPEQDLSLRVHACHSPEREIEVLCDQLRARFESDPSLQPHEVVVFAPDIERYVPAIESALGAAAGDAAIPYRIADRRTSRVSDITDTFLALLDLCGSRLYLSDVLDLLHRAPVRQRFELSDSDLDLTQRWLVRSGARWAIDAEHRAKAEQPALQQNSLRFGLDRLLLSIATRSGQSEPFHEVQPTADLEGEEARTLAKVSRYFEELFTVARELGTQRPAKEWAGLLGAALSKLLSDQAELALGHYALRSALADLLEDASLAHYEAPLSLTSIRRALADRIDATREGAGFLSGGITFCEHVPMRAIPFRVVCMLGLDDESFPRRSTRPSFDLMAKQPRLGDRTVRDDDRQLFLEAVLSARDALIITYCGRSPKDDSLRPPSVLLDQLLRVVDRHVVLGAARGLTLDFEGGTAQRISHVHALSRFDRRYFKHNKDLVYFSYDQGARSVAESWLDDKPRRSPAFVSRPIAIDKPLDHTLDLDDLVRFFRLPAKHFVQTRLGVYLPRELDPIEDREPLAPDALERYGVGRDLLASLADLSGDERQEKLAREGRIPPGTLGRLWLGDQERTLSAINAAWPSESKRPALRLDVAVGERRISGTLRNLHEHTQIERTFSSPRAKHSLACWIPHLLLCAAQPSVPWRSALIGRKDDAAVVKVFGPEPDALSLLAALIHLYELGQTSPLPFFVDAAEPYVKARNKGETHEAALSRIPAHARTPEARRDLDDPYVRQVFGVLTSEDLADLTSPGMGPETSFGALSLSVLGPMLHNAERAEP